MRTGILFWSTVSGAVLGIFCGVLVLGVLVIAASALPPIQRVAERFRAPALVLLLVVVPALGGVLGYLEGRAKLS